LVGTMVGIIWGRRGVSVVESKRSGFAVVVLFRGRR
jgi:hypothetical protein